jgi:protein O-GlcNAc transferase
MTGDGQDMAQAAALFAALDASGARPTAEHISTRSNFAENLRRAGRFAESEQHQRRALAWAPDFGGAHYNLGVLLLGQGRAGEAAACFAEAERLMPDFAAAAINLSAALREAGDGPGAVAAARRALGKPGGAGQPAAWANLSAALLGADQPSAAGQALGRGLALSPALGEGWANLAAALKETGREEAALTAVARALTCGVADTGGALAQQAQLLRRLCRWDDLPAVSAALRRAADGGGSARIHPWIFLNEGMGPAAEQAVARRFAAGFVTAAARNPLPALATPVPIAESGPLRIGYLSGDFHDHATAWLLAQTLERHDRRRVTVSAYSFGPDDGGAMRRRLTAGCDRFIDIRPLSHTAAAQRIRADGVQILVDLKGHTQGARQMIAALRPAPVQAQWLGYPGTMGAPFIDYILADSTVAPLAEQEFYDERIVHLPGCYQPNDGGRVIDPAPATRADHGLPPAGVVFCGFNAAYKLNSDVFDVWCGLLRQAPGAVLWLLRPGSEAAVVNLRRAAERRGVGAERLVFAPRRPQAAYLAQFRLADVFLDTWPVGAHTTAGDALWAGCPVVTWEGPAFAGLSFAGRVAASLLRASGLPELIADSPAGYAALAAALAADPPRLAVLRARLATAREESGVFDGARFAAKLEDAYEAMWARYEGGLTPEGLGVRGG